MYLVRGPLRRLQSICIHVAIVSLGVSIATTCHYCNHNNFSPIPQYTEKYQPNIFVPDSTIFWRYLYQVSINCANGDATFNCARQRTGKLARLCGCKIILISCKKYAYFTRNQTDQKHPILFLCSIRHKLVSWGSSTLGCHLMNILPVWSCEKGSGEKRSICVMTSKLMMDARSKLWIGIKSILHVMTV